jgi:hypothetical protein
VSRPRLAPLRAIVDDEVRGGQQSRELHGEADPVDLRGDGTEHEHDRQLTDQREGKDAVRPSRRADRDVRQTSAPRSPWHNCEGSTYEFAMGSHWLAM